MAILGVVAAGRLRRGSSRSDTRFLAPYHLDGESVRLPLQCLAREGLVRLPLSGPPELAERGASARPRWSNLDNGCTASPCRPV